MDDNGYFYTQFFKSFLEFFGSYGSNQPYLVTSGIKTFKLFFDNKSHTYFVLPPSKPKIS